MGKKLSRDDIDAIFNKYHQAFESAARMVGLAWGIPESEWDDLAQDGRIVFLLLLLDSQTRQQQDYYVATSWAIARNCAMNTARKIKRLRKRLTFTASPDRFQDPHRSEQENAELQDLLCSLNIDAQILIKRVFEERASQKEIAEDCGVTESAITQRKQRTLKKLRTLLF